MKCGTCGKPLAGILRENDSKMRSSAKSKKRPTRMYGGSLCPTCSRKEIKKRARK